MSLESVLASMSGTRPPLGSAGDSRSSREEPEKRSLLNEALHEAVGVAWRGESNIRNELENYTSQFIASVPLFIGGGRGLAASSILFGLNQAKAGDSTENKLIDFGLGAMKGAGTKFAFDHLGAKKNWNFAAKGVAMGASSRGFDVALSRETWFDGRGEFTPFSGVYSTGSSMLHPLSLATDVVTFGAAHYGIKYADSVTKGAIQASPRLQHVVTGTTFGFTAGALGELQRQLSDPHPHFDPFAIVGRGGASALAMSGAAAAGFKLTSPADLHVVQPKTEPFTAFDGLKEKLSRIKSLLRGDYMGLALASGDVVEGAEARRSPQETKPVAGADRPASPQQEHGAEPAPRIDQNHGSESAPPIEQNHGSEPAPRIEQELGTEREAGPQADTVDADRKPGTELRSSFEHLSDEDRRQIVRRQLEILEPATREWVDLASSRRSIRDYWHARERLENELVQKDAHVGGSDLDSLMEQRRANGTATHQEISLHDEMTRLRHLDPRAIATFEQRLGGLQNRINENCREHGMPPCRLVVADLSPVVDGSYELGRNEISIRFGDLLSPEDAVRVRESLVHELVHHGQDLLIIRSLSQELGLNRRGLSDDNQSSVQRLQDLYLTRTGYSLNPAFASDVLRRYGACEPLTQQEMTHARNLAESIRTFVQTARILEHQVTTLSEKSRELHNEPSGITPFLEHLVSSPEERLRFFGSTDSQWLMDLKTARGFWPKHKVQLAQKVIDRMMEHCERLDQQRTAMYRSAVHELAPWQSSSAAESERH